MLIVDTTNIGTEGNPAFRTAITSGELIKCFMLGIPCVLRTETPGTDDTKNANMTLITSINYGGATSYIATNIQGGPVIATVTDPKDPAVFLYD